MNMKWIAATALALSFSLPVMQAQAGVHKEWHEQRLAHHQQEADFHLARHKYHKSELRHEPHSWWHNKRAHHHLDEYKEHVKEIKEHKSELAEDAAHEAREESH